VGLVRVVPLQQSDLAKATAGARWRAGLLTVIALGAFLRLYRLDEAPGWYGDEFVHLDLARNLASFEPRIGGFRVDWFGTIAHPPLFFLLGSLVTSLFGDSIGALRLVPALSGTFAIALLYRAGTLLRSRAMGLLAAAAYAVLPIAVVLDRRAYSYSLVLPLALGVTVCMLGFLQRRERRCLYTGALLLSLLLVTGHYTAPLLIVLLVFSAIHDRARLHRYAALMLICPMLFSLVFLLPRWETTLFTIGWELGRASFETFGPLDLLRRNLALASRDAALAVAALGVLFARGAGVAWCTLVFLSVSQFLIYRRPDLAGLDYPAGAFLGFFALPFAAFFFGVRDLGLRAADRWLRPGPRRAAAAAVTFATLGAPVLLLVSNLAVIAPAVWRAHLATPVDRWSEERSDVLATRAFLEKEVGPEQLVAGSPVITGSVRGSWTDLMQSFVYETGRGTLFYPDYAHQLPDYRAKVFAFDCSIERVDFLVLSLIDWERNLRLPFARVLLQTDEQRLLRERAAQEARNDGAPEFLTIRGRPWQVVFRIGSIVVLRNPEPRHPA